MAFGQFDFFSHSLTRRIMFLILLPNDCRWSGPDNPHYQRPMKTLYMLHGHTCNSWDPLMHMPLESVSNKYNLAIVLPTGENSFYLDRKGADRKYGILAGEELVEYTRKTFGLSRERKDTYIAGISMGGFGAIHTGLAYPNTFDKIMAFSPAMIIHQITGMEKDYSREGADYDYYTSVFGDLEKLETSRNNPEQLVLDLKKANERIPDLFMVCGTEDALLPANREFYDFMTKQQVPMKYKESNGGHDYIFWNKYLEEGIQWLLKEL